MLIVIEIAELIIAECTIIEWAVRNEIYAY
jgi:hypothetical protein